MRFGPLREVSVLVGLLGAALGLVSSARAELGRVSARVRDGEDVYLLPPSHQLKVLSLGYDAALADVLWAHTLVTQGLHLTERRRFDNVTRLYGAINELAPDWRTPYLMADALITLQTVPVGFEEVAAARVILERGVKHRPLDAELWLNLGQFVTYTAPASHMDDHPDLIPVWREQGLRYLERAAELGADSNIGWQALGGASRLLRAGNREAAIRYYSKQYAIAEDPELRATIERRLTALLGEREKGRVIARRKAFDALRDAEFRWLGSDEGALMLLGPQLRAECVGGGNTTPGCATTWREWSRRQRAPTSEE